LKVKINGKELVAYEEETILELAKRKKIDIPSLCHKKGFEGLGRCRMCLVEINDGNRKKIVSSCAYPVKENLEVLTHTDEIIKMRKDIVMLMYLKSSNNKYVKDLAEEYGIVKPKKYLQKLSDDCILCGLCVEACKELGTNAISMVQRGTEKKVSTPYDDESKDCIGCGSCAEVCPTDAIKVEEKENTRTIWNRTFDLLTCKICGKTYTTVESHQYSEKLLGEKIEPICDECKMKMTADTFKEAFKNIY
jgi:NADH dehydrogenase/NADH:ubiquinone oxidoreductase subunit G